MLHRYSGQIGVRWSGSAGWVLLLLSCWAGRVQDLRRARLGGRFVARRRVAAIKEAARAAGMLGAEAATARQQQQQRSDSSGAAAAARQQRGGSSGARAEVGRWVGGVVDIKRKRCGRPWACLQISLFGSGTEAVISQRTCAQGLFIRIISYL